VCPEVNYPTAVRWFVELTLPDYQTLMLPFLQTVGGGQERSMDEIIELLAKVFNLTEQDRNEMLPSGKQRTFYNRVRWTRTYLKKAGLVETPGVGKVKITSRGLDVLKKNPAKIDRKFLMQFPEFVEFQRQDVIEEPSWATVGTTVYNAPPGAVSVSGVATGVFLQTPNESIEFNYRSLRSALSEELLDRIKSCSPQFFESLVLDLLVAMGYGGSRSDAERVGRSGDGGIDGTINEDKLGLDVVYVQAKRWDQGIVGKGDVQRFAGSLGGKRAMKGVFITTSKFAPAARDYVKDVDKKIVLIDGDELAQLMIDHGIGVAEVANYKVKKVDADYFSEG
jgi:restriction system protein